MDQRFCIRCGAELEGGERFCSKCGQAVEGLNAAFTQPLQPVHPNAAASTPGVQSAHPYAATPKRHTKTGAVIASITTFFVVICVTVGVLVATNSFPAEESGKTSVSEEESAANNDSNPRNTGNSDLRENDDLEEDSPEANAPNAGLSSDFSNEESSVVLDEEMALYYNLIDAYDQLSQFNGRISEAAVAFNNNYASSDDSIRHQLYNEAIVLAESIGDVQYSLYWLDVPSNSINAYSYEVLTTCYDDCAKRIGVICEAWQISTSYDDPRAHEAEILEPITRDNVNGTNRYYTEFKEMYPYACPIRP